MSLLLAWNGNAQVKSIEEVSVYLSLNDVKVEQAFKELERITEFNFVFASREVRESPLISVASSGESLYDMLVSIAVQSNLSFKQIDHNIHVKRSDKENLITVVEYEEITISGTVTDNVGEPIPGVTVLVKGTTIGNATDLDGKYTLTAPEESTLVFSFIGYVSQEISIGNRSTIDVTLMEDETSMDEVVVVGYGTQALRDVSGSVALVTEKNFNKGVIRNAVDLIQGKVAGLVITTAGGDVTDQQTIRLRGTSSLTGFSGPFVVIDGIPGMDINAVAPQDIESISVLKDASAVAIYGSRSASGVILITTKKGKAGQTTTQYESYVAFDAITNKPKMLTGPEWRNYTTEKGLNVVGLDKGANTDWFKEITRQGVSQNHSLSVSGGLEKGNYRASINYLDRQGIMRDNMLERYNAVFTVNQKALNDRINFAFNGGSMKTTSTPSDPRNAILAYNMLPVYPVKNADGSWFDVRDYNQGNPVHNIAENKNLSKTDLLYGALKTDIKILNNLTTSVNLFRQSIGENRSLYNGSTTPKGRTDLGYAYRGNQAWEKNLIEWTGEFAQAFKNHDLKVLGGYSYEENLYRSESASNRNFISDSFQDNNLSAGNTLFPTDVNSYRSLNKLISFFGRVNYDYSGKYLLTATLRRDGSSKFGVNNKWGVFPSFSAGWRISDEAFMPKSSAINDLKLRVGYGIVGNQEGIDPYTSIALYGRDDEFFDNGQWRNTYKYKQNDNPDLRWERTASINVGLDYVLFDNRLNGSIDVYDKQTSDLLYVYNVPVPPYIFPTMLANVGNMSNKGLEVVINGEIVRKKDLQYNLTLNFAHNSNVITKLSSDIFQTKSIRTGNVNLRGSGNLTSHIIEVGKEVGSFYNWKGNGIDDNGKFIIEDMNRDEEINSSDFTYIGNAIPKFSYGILNSVTYKNFDLSIFLRGVYGNDVLNNPSLMYGNTTWLPGNNVLKEALTNGITESPKLSSYYIQNGSFLRLDNATLAYSFSFKNFTGLKGAKVFLSGQNLFLITKFKGGDPEVTMSGLSPGVLEDYFIPRARIVSFGINFNL